MTGLTPEDCNCALRGTSIDFYDEDSYCHFHGNHPSRRRHNLTPAEPTKDLTPAEPTKDQTEAIVARAREFILAETRGELAAALRIIQRIADILQNNDAADAIHDIDAILLIEDITAILRSAGLANSFHAQDVLNKAAEPGPQEEVTGDPLQLDIIAALVGLKCPLAKATQIAAEVVARSAKAHPACKNQIAPGVAIFCDREPGHADPYHEGRAPSTARVRWSDDELPDEDSVCKACRYRGAHGPDCPDPGPWPTRPRYDHERNETNVCGLCQGKGNRFVRSLQFKRPSKRPLDTTERMIAERWRELAREADTPQRPSMIAWLDGLRSIELGEVGEWVLCCDCDGSGKRTK